MAGQAVGDLVKMRYALVIGPLLLFISLSAAVAFCGIGLADASYTVGVWDNFNYDKPASYWASAARSWGGDSGLLDLVVAQAGQDGTTTLPFPFQASGTLRSSSQTDLAESYLDQFDSEGLGIILSIQPMNADVTDLIGMILGRYGHHGCIRGVNIDMEWKKTGTPEHVSNAERDAWLGVINSYNPQMKLFLTCFKDYTCLPDDNGQIVVLYDGLGDTQENLLRAYGELAKHFAATGIYTGYSSSRPATASDESILSAAPGTQYIIHVDPDNSLKATTAGIGNIQTPQSLESPQSASGGFGMTSLFGNMKMPDMKMPAMSGGQSSNPGISTGGSVSDIFKGVGGSGFSRDFSFGSMTGRAKEFFGCK